MPRCFISLPRHGLYAAAWALAACLPGHAQPLSTQAIIPGTPAGATAPTAARTFPEQARRGELRITAMPTLTLNGQAVRTTPGFRLFNEHNQLVFAHQLTGRTFAVRYVIEPQTQWLHTAWLLTAAEARLR